MPKTYTFNPISDKGRRFVDSSMFEINYGLKTNHTVVVHKGKFKKQRVLRSDELRSDLRVVDYLSKRKTLVRGIHFSLPMVGQEHEAAMHFDILTGSREFIWDKYSHREVELNKSYSNYAYDFSFATDKLNMDHVRNYPFVFEVRRTTELLVARAFMDESYLRNFGLTLTDNRQVLDILLNRIGHSEIFISEGDSYDAEQIALTVLEMLLTSRREGGKINYHKSNAGYMLDTVVPDLVDGVLHVSGHFDPYLVGNMLLKDAEKLYEIEGTDVKRQMPEVLSAFKWPEGYGYFANNSNGIDEKSIEFSNNIVKLYKKTFRLDRTQRVLRSL